LRNLAAIVHASSDGIIGKTIDGIVTSWNPGAEATYGYSAAEMIGQPTTRLIPQDRLEEFHSFLKRLQQGEKIRHYETERTRKDGTRIWVSLSTNPIRNEKGDIVGASTITRDITDRKQAVAAIDRSERRYRSLVTATSQIVWSTNAQGDVVEDMPLWRKYTGMTVDEIKGSGWIHSLHPDDRPRIAEVWREAVRLRSLYDVEYRIRRHDGEYRDFSVRGVPVIETDGSIREWIGTCTDITSRKRAEAEILALNRDLEMRVEQRTAELTRVNTELTTAVKELEAFSYSVSHDLRAPLRHISGFSQILLEEFAPQLSPEATHYLQRIDQGTIRMGHLVDDLLNLSRVGRSDIALQVTGLGSVVEEVISGLKPDIGDRQVEWKIGALPFVECDPTLIRQVFQNLLFNAVKFTRPRAQAVIEVGQKVEGDAPVIYVRDNGVGFSMKYADKLFGVFQRLHRAEDFEGTGVGLATVQRIIQKHGGRVWAEAELDKGASFYFTLGQSEKAEMRPQALGAGAHS
jgi:PAS domain S-box-containing protein